MTASSVVSDRNAVTLTSACVDSALPGSQLTVSLSSTSASLAPKLPSTTVTAIQNPRTTHLTRRPHTARATRPVMRMSPHTWAARVTSPLPLGQHAEIPLSVSPLLGAHAHRSVVDQRRTRFPSILDSSTLRRIAATQRDSEPAPRSSRLARCSRRSPEARRWRGGAVRRECGGMSSEAKGAGGTGTVVAAVMDAPWSRPSAEMLAAVDSRTDGLTVEEAEQRLERFGPNELAPPKRMPWWRRVLAQFDDVLIYILLVAAAFKAILADWVDFGVILGVAVINAIIGLVQEGRAERALDAIKDMLSVRAHVVRSGSVTDVDADGLVPRDIVRLRPGDRVPADVRLLE